MKSLGLKRAVHQPAGGLVQGHQVLVAPEDVQGRGHGGMCVRHRGLGILCTNLAGQVSAADRERLQGAKRSNSRSYCEYLQRRRPPEAADAHGAVIRAEEP